MSLTCTLSHKPQPGPVSEFFRDTQRPKVSKYARSVSYGFLCALEACLVNFLVALKVIYLFGCLKGTLVVTKVLGGFFLSYPEVSATLMGPVESSRTRSSLAFIRKLWGTFCLYTESFRRRFF